VAASPHNHLYRSRELIVNSSGNGAVFIRALGQMDFGPIAFAFFATTTEA